MRCCTLTRAPALHLLHRSQITEGDSGRREPNEVLTGTGVEADLPVVTLVGGRQMGLEKARRRK